MIIWAIISGMALIGIALHMLFFYKLRRDCPDEWTRLGSPNPLLPNDAELGWAITKYLLSGSFEHISDKKLVALGRVLRWYDWFYITAFLAVMLLFFYSLVA